jgi:hypothetical protein
MARPRVYTNEQMIAALTQTKGMVYLAARTMGCDPGTIFDRAKRSPAVAACIRTQRAEVVDTAELKLYSAILAGEPWAIRLCLTTLGRDRGYAEDEGRAVAVAVIPWDQIVAAPDRDEVEARLVAAIERQSAAAAQAGAAPRLPPPGAAADRRTGDG